LTDQDKYACLQVRQKGGELSDFKPDFQDKRLSELYFRYRARNYPNALTEAEHEKWEQYRREKLLSPTGLPAFGNLLQQLAVERTSATEQALLTDLQLYGESIVPFSD
jgi:exodeoxyribonuclease-1